MNIIIMLILISLLVLVHEAGHFLAARLFGVRVSRFGFGLPIGPTLFEKKFGDTTVYIHAFLLGGYVSFPDDIEEDEKENKDENNENDEEKLPLDSPLRFKNKANWQKAIIVAAGVFMNVVFAIFLVMFCAIFYHKLPSGKYNVYVHDFAKTADSSILNSGIQKNDKILSANDYKLSSAYQLIFVTQNSKMFDGMADKDIIDRKLLEIKKLNPNGFVKNKNIILPKTTPEAAFSADEKVLMGLQKYESDEVKLTDEQKQLRDKVYNKTKINYDGTYSENDLAAALSDTYKPIKIKVQRGDKILTFENLKTNSDGFLGVALSTDEVFQEIKTPKDVIFVSSKYLYDNTKLMILGLWQLFTGKIPLSEMHGIVAITKVGGDIIQTSGMFKGLLLSAIISVNLALINLLPIPALDGGHLMFLFIQKITGRELDEKIIEKISGVFFMLLIVLLVFVVFNDIYALVTNKL